MTPTEDLPPIYSPLMPTPGVVSGPLALARSGKSGALGIFRRKDSFSVIAKSGVVMKA